MSEPVTLSIVIPAYNEQGRIAPSLEQILAYLNQQEYESEIIVVDDGSTDHTAPIVERFIRRESGKSVQLTLLSHPTNRGKGSGVKTGVLHARGAVVVFTDADLSAPITELPKLLGPIEQRRCDIVIGSRGVDRSLIGQRQSPWREVAGRTFNLLMRALTGLKFKDTQCGFKAYRREAAQSIFRQQQLQGFGFDVEILYLAKTQGLRTDEVPVVWNHAEGSRVHVFRDSLRMLVELLKIRWYALVGRYTEGIASTSIDQPDRLFSLPPQHPPHHAE
jgi:glycosyltransferase involved in cell wall biosynthesis